MSWDDVALIAVLVGCVAGTYALHRKSWPTTKLFWTGLACFLGWAFFLVLVPGGAHFAWYWLIIDAPLNGGWIFLWSWPVLVESHRRSRASWRALRHNWQLLRLAIREDRNDERPARKG